MGKEIDPSDIGKHPTIIKAAQTEMTQTDVLVCGKCNNVFHFIELFKEHKESGCKLESSLKDCRETKPKVWAFLLWKASQLNSEDTANVNSWKLYQTWVKMDEAARETWVVAGRTIQSFAKMGHGNLQEMPVKITKTIVDTTPESSPDIKKLGGATVNKLVKRGIEIKSITKPKKDDTDKDNTTDLDSDDDLELSSNRSNDIVNKVENTHYQQPVKRMVGRPPAIISKTVPQNTILSNKNLNRLAKRTIATSSKEIETEDHLIEKILAKRFNPRCKQHEYLIKWDKLMHDMNTWEPYSHLESCLSMVDHFERQLAKQKEHRAALAAKAQLEQQENNEVTNSPMNVVNQSPSNSRPVRNSKVRAFGQVKQWCAEENSNNAITIKRKSDDSDYDVSEDQEDEIPHKRIKSDNPAIAQALLKAGQTGNVRIVQVNKTTGQTTNVTPKTLNGSALNVAKAMGLESPDKNSADVVITNVKDGKTTTGVVKKPGVTLNSVNRGINLNHKNEAQIRLVSKSEAASSGVVRIVRSNPSEIKSQQGTPSGMKLAPRIINSSGRPSLSAGPRPTIIQQKQVMGIQRQQIATQPRQQIRQIVHSQVRPVTPQQARVQQHATQIKRTSLSPGTSPNSAGKATITRYIKSAPNSKQSTPEQKILALTKHGDLKVVRKGTSHHIDHLQSGPDDDDDDDDCFPDPFPTDLPPPEPASPPRPLTLCPITGKVLGRAEGEPTPAPSPEPVPEKKPDIIEMQQLQQQLQQQHSMDTNSTEQHISSHLIKQEVKEEEAPEQQIQQLATHIETEDGQIQQLLTNEDGSPLLVTGEDGTVYQVAGKNAEGQTVLIAQGADGEQQCVYVATQEGDDDSVLTLDNAIAEAVAQMQPEQVQQTSETDVTQQLQIATDSDSQDGQITAEVVQTDSPSPGGTRRVVLLLPDGSFMMTEVNDEQYQQLNLVS